MEAQGDDKRDGAWRDYAFFLGLALVFRLFLLFATPNIIDTADAIHYIDTAKHLAAGAFREVNPKIPVLYPLLGALVHLLEDDFEWACIVVSLIASTLLVVPLYALAREMHGRGAARIAALVVAIGPWFGDYAGRVGPDALGCTLWFTSIVLLARGLRRGRGWLAGAPWAFFALHLTRPEGTVLAAASVGAALLLCAGSDNRKLLRLIPFVAVCAVFLALNTLVNRAFTGQATANVRTQIALSEMDYVPMAATGMKLFGEVLPIMLGPALLLFLGVGFFRREHVRERDVRLELYVLYFAALQLIAATVLMSPEPRYLMSVIAAMSIWSARGLVLVSVQAGELRWGRWLRPLPAVFLVGLLLTGTATSVAADRFRGRPGVPLEYKAAGRWMKAHLEPGLIFTRKPQVGYYADMPSTGPDLDDTLEEAIQRARSVGARYVVIDERYTVHMVPSLKPLLEPANAPAGLELLVELRPYPESKVVIYEIVGGKEGR